MYTIFLILSTAILALLCIIFLSLYSAIKNAPPPDPRDSRGSDEVEEKSDN